jgi:FkbM family methyltransferase
MVEGQGSGQHGEDRILALFFKDQEKGFVVDVGAADGWTNSNSVGLLKRPEWKGILIEPDPVQFKELNDRYRDRVGVNCVNCGVGTDTGTKPFHCAGQVSTFDDKTKQAAIDVHRIVYREPIKVEVKTLTRILEDFGIEKEIDFLTIDAEGMNYNVWQSLSDFYYKPKLVCIEGKKYHMEGYHEFCVLGGNTFYIRDDLCMVL